MEYYNFADMVFVGTVVNIEPWPSIFNVYTQEYTTITTTFDVNLKLKGDLNNSMSVKASSDEASCGVDFKKNKMYLVFAYDKVDDYPHTNLCSGNQIISEHPELDFIEDTAFGDFYNIFDSVWFFIVLIAIMIITIIITVIITSIVVARRLKTKNHKQT